MADRFSSLPGLGCRRQIIPTLVTIMLLATGTPAIATTLYTGTYISLVASNPQPVGKSLVAFTLSAVGSSGAAPNTFDSTNSGAGGIGISTVGENLAQVWEFNAVPTPTLNLNVPGDIPQSIDTHFLVDSNAIFSVVPPQENRILANPAEDPNAGFGDRLWGSFALPQQSSNTWNFAYVVVPLNTTVQFNFQLAAPGFAAESINTSWTLTFLPGDVNYDGVVNGLDIDSVASNWLANTRVGDANGDGVVNGLDISLIAAHWLQTSTSGTIDHIPAPEPNCGTISGLTIASALYLLRRRIRSG